MNEFSAKTIEEAIEEGLKELNLSREEADIVVLEEPVKKLFFSTKAKVRITKKQTDGERTVKFLEELFTLMNIPTTTEVTEDEEKITFNLITTNSSALIGYRGEVLDSLQCLAGAVANIGKEEYKRVVVNCEGYREKREETLKNLATKLADKAVKTGRKVVLEPMNPFERRIIHSALSERTDVKTHSEGKEPNRYIAIVPENIKPYFNDRKGGRRDFGKNNNGGRREHKNREEKRGYSNSSKPKRTGWGGTFLGNSLKESAEKETNE